MNTVKMAKKGFGKYLKGLKIGELSKENDLPLDLCVPPADRPHHGGAQHPGQGGARPRGHGTDPRLAAE